MEKSTGLSVIIITRNEEEALPACLDSIKSLADEIVLVDSGSTDRTLDIARAYSARVFHRDWNGYSAQKQFALDQASKPWALNIDADERVSPALAEEIKSVMTGPTEGPANGYHIPFHHYFCGTRLRFGGTQGETHLRLFKKEKARYGTETVHEGIHVEPPEGTLKNPILHYSYKDIHDYLTKCNEYTTMIAAKKFSQGVRAHWWQLIRLPWEFVSRAFLKLGILDGEKGLTYALLSSYYVWLKYAKLRDLEVGKK